MSIFKDILAKSSDGALHQETFLYHEGSEENDYVTDTERNFLQCLSIVQVSITTDRISHLEVKLDFCLRELKDYTFRMEKHIANIEDPQVQEESRKAYADYVVMLMQRIGRITMTLIRNDREVEDEMAILCANFYLGERDSTND